MSPRCVPLAVAREYLGGRHPATLGVSPVGQGRGTVWDLRAIDAKLDARIDGSLDAAGNPTAIAPVGGAPAGPANDLDDEIAQLEKRVARAARR